MQIHVEVINNIPNGHLYLIWVGALVCDVWAQLYPIMQMHTRYFVPIALCGFWMHHTAYSNCACSMCDTCMQIPVVQYMHVRMYTAYSMWCFVSAQHGGMLRCPYLFRSSGFSPDDGLADLVVLGGEGGCKWSVLALVSDGEVDGGVVEEDVGALALFEGDGYVQSAATRRVLQVKTENSSTRV